MPLLGGKNVESRAPIGGERLYVTLFVFMFMFILSSLVLMFFSPRACGGKIIKIFHSFKRFARGKVKGRLLCFC